MANMSVQPSFRMPYSLIKYALQSYNVRLDTIRRTLGAT